MQSSSKAWKKNGVRKRMLVWSSKGRIIQWQTTVSCHMLEPLRCQSMSASIPHVMPRICNNFEADLQRSIHVINTLAKVLSWWLQLITITHLPPNELASSDTPSKSFIGLKVFLQVNTVVLQRGSFCLFIYKMIRWYKAFAPVYAKPKYELTNFAFTLYMN